MEKEPLLPEVIAARLAVLDALAIELENQLPEDPAFRRLRADAFLPIDRWIHDHGEVAAANVLPAAMFKVLSELADALGIVSSTGEVTSLVAKLRHQAVSELETVELEGLLDLDPPDSGDV